MEITAAWWVTWVLGFIPLMILILQWWNELRYVLPLKRVLASKNLKLPPGSMGFPFIGELLTFLWYFKIVRRPDDFINSKRAKYGDGVGMYRTYLFGSPSIIAYSPAVTQFVFRSDNLFPYRFPTNDLVGANSMLAATGEHHARVKSYVIAALAHTDSLKKIVLHVQPGIKASLHSWAEKGIVTTFGVVKKMVFENIAQIFVGIEPGPLLDDIGRYYAGLVKGFRAQPFNIPGTTYYHAIQCRKKLMKIFKLELEKRKENKKLDGENKDLMDMLKQIKDEEGKKLSDEEVLDNIVSLFLGGFDSTASVSAWAIYYLAKNPDVLQILREENMQLGAVEGELVTFDQVSQMKYTKKVVEETIRMSNVSLIAFRSGDYDVEYEGYLLPKGWKVLQWIRYSHTNSEYFENPSYFNPDRWNQSTKPEAYQAFGGGSMKCVGTELVHTQLAVFLHHLVLGYKWELINPNAKINYLPYPKPEDGGEIAITAI